jgi:hypothetical protein
LLQPQSQQPQQLLQHPKSESEEGRSTVGPSC